MNYLLAVLTHGEAPTLERCLDSFRARVSPPPTETLVLHDGYSEETAETRKDGTRFIGAAPQGGFCKATRRLWEEAAVLALLTGCDYVFWLEHDFVFNRDVDFRDLAAVLDDHPSLAQMALMRQAVNAQEKKAGGLFESRPGQYEPRWGNPTPGDEFAPEWHEHRAYLTTNPMLMTREFMARNPWPAYPDQCEGRFGIDLVERSYTFGVWGTGEPWVAHIGERDGFGY